MLIPVIPLPEKSLKECSQKAGSHDRFLLKFKEVTGVNQHFYDLKQHQRKNWLRKLDRVN